MNFYCSLLICLQFYYKKKDWNIFFPICINGLNENIHLMSTSSVWFHFVCGCEIINQNNASGWPCVQSLNSYGWKQLSIGSKARFCFYNFHSVWLSLCFDQHTLINVHQSNWQLHRIYLQYLSYKIGPLSPLHLRKKNKKEKKNEKRTMQPISIRIEHHKTDQFRLIIESFYGKSIIQTRTHSFLCRRFFLQTKIGIQMVYRLNWTLSLSHHVKYINFMLLLNSRWHLLAQKVKSIYVCTSKRLKCWYAEQQRKKKPEKKIRSNGAQCKRSCRILLQKLTKQIQRKKKGIMDSIITKEHFLPINRKYDVANRVTVY